MNRIAVLSVAASLAIAAPAAANPAPVYNADARGGVYGRQFLPSTAFTDTAEADTISNIIFLNRCKGGCVIHSANNNNAATQDSTIPNQPPGTDVSISEFPYDDTAWATVVQCVKEIYSPFNVQITDVDPGAGVVHHEIIVAGTGAELMLPQGVLGISPVSADRTPVNNNISFAFAGSYSNTDNPNVLFGLIDLCATIGQETAHSWGLDHEYACVDPMTYLSPCGGQRFFRNKDIECGTGAPGECNCDGRCQTAGPTQNSHQRILGVFGPGQSIVPGPVASIVSPADQTTVQNGFTVFMNSMGKRGTFHARLILNGYTWVDKDVDIQPPQGTNLAPIYAKTFQLNAPTDVPDGVIDVEAQACDDLDQCSSGKIQVTKGAPCADASSCAKGQKCEAGKCFWDPATGELGDDCGYPQACKSGLCLSTSGGMMCSQQCFITQAGSCPDMFECVLDNSGTGYCLPKAPDTGCCNSSATGADALAAKTGLVGLVLVIALRRRRRRA